MLLGLVMLLPGACVILLVQRPAELLAEGSSLVWTFLAISAGGVALIVLAIRETIRR